jgi:hypothetical protein
MLRRIRTLPEEVLFFGRLGLYGLIIGMIYWFVAYEAAGTALLLLFGGGATLLATILLVTARGDADDLNLEPADSLRPDGPFGDESGRIPGPSLAPIEVGLGLALASLGVAFGPWFVVAAAVPLVSGGVGWLRSASRELAAVERDDGEPPPGS